MSGGTRYFLTTARVGFRCWSAGDLPLALALWGDPAVTQFIGGPFSPQQIQQRLDDEIASMRAHGVQYWPLFLLGTGAHLGCGGLRPYDLEHGVYELGFHLRPAYWRQGLAVEVGQAIITFAFDTISAQALFAGHHPANHASQRVLEKLGFRFSHAEFYPPTGLEHRSYVMKCPRRDAAGRG